MQSHPRLDVYGMSLRGIENERNHDHFAIATLNKSLWLRQSSLTIDDESRVHGHNQGHLFLVADGSPGSERSAADGAGAIDCVVRYFLNEMPWLHFIDGDPVDVTAALQDALQNAQSELGAASPGGRVRIGTTMTLAFVFWPDLFVAHVGSGSCYLSRQGAVQRLTRAPVTRRFRRRHDPALLPDVGHVELEVGDAIALVTDGLADRDAEPELQALCRRDLSAERTCAQIVRGSGRDDRTAVVARFEPAARVHERVGRARPASPLSARRDAPRRPRDRRFRPRWSHGASGATTTHGPDAA